MGGLTYLTPEGTPTSDEEEKEEGPDPYVPQTLSVWLTDSPPNFPSYLSGH